ncbi:MAG: dienelactone hydrolase family protein, partial [Candidatus Nitrosotenuis sp.]
MEFVVLGSPRSQFLADVPVNMIECAEGFELIMKKTNGMPACVKPQTVSVLIERGWGIHILPNYENKDNNSDIISTNKGSFSVKTESVVYFDNYTGFLVIPEAEGLDFPGFIL